jgi:hypothetical protein
MMKKSTTCRAIAGSPHDGDLEPSTFPRRRDEVTVGLERIAIKPYQIITWISITARPGLALPPDTPRLPVILDTGHSHNLSIQDRHLADWARLDPATLPQIRTIRERGRQVPLHAANVWIHPNLPGKRDEPSRAASFLLWLDRGIAMHPAASQFPRLPLLGLRAFVRNQLHFTLDSARRAVSLRTPDWRTKIGRWLM